MTTFKRKPLTQRFKPKQEARNGYANWRRYLAVAPRLEHPLRELRRSLYEPLTLENGLSMEKPGYVNVSDVYSMEWQDAQPYWQGQGSLRQKTRLDAGSLKRLLDAAEQIGRFKAGEQYDPTLLAQPAFYPIAAPQLPNLPPSPDAGNPLPLAIAPVGRHMPPVAQAPQTPQIAKTTSTQRTHPPAGRSPANHERQPLLPIYHTRPLRPDHERDGGFFGWLWTYLKKTRLGIIVRFVGCCEY